MGDENIGFECFYAEKNEYLVVSLVGPLTKGNLGALEGFQAKINESAAHYVVFSFHDVKDLDLAGIGALAKMQKIVRAKPADLRICFLSEQFKKLLLKNGAIRQDEVTANLARALDSLKKSAS
jgi:anti-anti-sigma regulatory factor